MRQETSNRPWTYKLLNSSKVHVYCIYYATTTLFCHNLTTHGNLYICKQVQTSLHKRPPLQNIPIFVPLFLSEEGLLMEPFHTASCPPYWCPTGNHACWFPKPILWELTLFSSKNFLFFKEMFYSCWLHEWKSSITKPDNLYKVAPTKW